MALKFVLEAEMVLSCEKLNLQNLKFLCELKMLPTLYYIVLIREFPKISHVLSSVWHNKSSIFKWLMECTNLCLKIKP